MTLGDRCGSVVVVVFPGLVLTNTMCKLALQCKAVSTTAAETDFADSR